MKITTIIIDDEQPARDELRYLLSQYHDIEVIAEAESGNKGIALIKEYAPDLVFLDIQMPGKSGFEMVAELSGQSKLPLIIFATAYENYAVKAFEKSAVDYILKPFSTKRLDLSIQRVRGMLSGKSEKELNDKLQSLLHQIQKPRPKITKLSVEKDGKIHLIPLEDIVYCSYVDNTIMISSNKESLPIYGISTMEKLADHLAGTSFFRTHRSTLVNVDWIAEFSPWFNGKYNLVMADSQRTELTVSRSRVKEFKQQLGM